MDGRRRAIIGCSGGEGVECMRDGMAPKELQDYIVHGISRDGMAPKELQDYIVHGISRDGL
jgi:hypothetical protein